MKPNKIHIGLFILFFHVSLFSQNWPFLGNNDRGLITGTPGEIRRNNARTFARFHGGVDMTNPNPAVGSTAVAVYSVSAGSISWNVQAEGVDNGGNAWDAVISVGDREYKHVRILRGQNGNIAFLPGQLIAANTHIGNMFSSDASQGFAQHVHLNGIPSNIDVYDLFVPFSDIAAVGNPDGHLPVFWNWNNGQWVTQNNPNVLQFYTNGVNYTTDETTNPNTIKLFGSATMPANINLPQRGNFPATVHKIIFGDVDMVARVKDPGINEDGTPNNTYNNAPHSIEYRFCNQPRISPFPCLTPYNEEFSLHNIPANNVVPANAQNNSNNTFLLGSFHLLGDNRYIITNPPNNQNGRLRTAPNGPASDGRFVVGTKATDIDNESLEHYVPVIVDNFKPYIREAEIWRGGHLLVRNTWTFNTATNVATLHRIQNPSIGIIGNNITIVVRSSEPLRSENLQASLVPDVPNNPIPLGQPTSTNEFETEFTFNLTLNNNPANPKYCLQIAGRDYADNQLLRLQDMAGYPNTVTIPNRVITNAGWRWEPVQILEGIDAVTCADNEILCGLYLTDDSPSRSFSSLNEDCDCEPVADFTYIPQSDGLTIDFDASTSSGTEQLMYAWSFGGDGDGSGVMPEHAFSEGGTFLVTLTVTDECGTTSTAQQVVTVSEGESFEVAIQGPEQALPNQQVVFNAIVTGGVPPYKYTWSAINGDPAPIPGPSFKSDLHESEQIIVFHAPTLIGTATVYVEVEDAAGHKILVSHSIDISDNAITLDFNHFPTLPSGLSNGSPLIKDQYLYWVATVDPLLETPYPADYTWDFGDGTPPVTEPNGQVEHIFDANGVYKVTLTMCDLFGSCITATKTYTVGSGGGGPSGYVILPENTTPGVWTINGPAYPVELANLGGSLCGDFQWTLNWADCNYGALSQGSSSSSVIFVNSASFDDVSDPNGILPWGCLSVFANDVGCGYAAHDCAVFIQPSALKVSNITIQEESGCIYKLSAAVSGGGWKFENFSSDPNTPKMYKDYEWKAFDIDQPDQEIEILTGANTPTPTINTQHSYFKKFNTGNYPQFVVKLRVTDFANQIKEAGDVVSINAFRITAKDSYTRCPGTVSYFESTPLAQGGTRNYAFTWTTTSGNLNFESNDIHDPNPYFRAPANGTKTYNLLVKMLDGNGVELCQLSKTIVVSAAPLTLSMPAAAGACSTIGQASIGPSNLGVQGGSGNFGYEWTTAVSTDLAHLSDVFAANPIVHGVPDGQTIVYTLRVGDLVSDCTATADVSVTGYANNISLTLQGASTVCYGEAVTIRGNVNPSSQINHEWTTNHPKTELLEFGNYGPKKLLTFSEIMCSYPGTYNIALKATDIVSGCTSEATTTLTIRNPWRYEGYVSKIKSAVKNSSQPFWEPGSNNYFTSNPPSLNNIEVLWDPYTPENITYNGNTLPSNGTFVPTKEVPFLTMTVYDNVSGCSKTLRTMRYIISEHEPELSIFAENTFSCIGAEVCFEAIFDAQLANYSTSLLPSSITATVAINAPSILQQPNFKFIPVQLLLQNASGLYKGSVCEADFFQLETGHSPHYAVSLSMPSGIWNNVESPTIEVAINATPTSLGHEIGCVPLFNSTYQRGLSFRFGQNCIVNKTHDFRSYTIARDYIELFPDPDPENDFDIELIPSSISGGYNKGAFLGIDPCITTQMLEDAPVEDLTVITGEVRNLKVDTNSQSLLSMEVFPNPFGDEINVAFQIPTDCAGKTSITLFDITGKKIEVIHQQEHCASGAYQLNYHAEQLSSGLYFCELRTCNNQRIIRKLVKVSNH